MKDEDLEDLEKFESELDDFEDEDEEAEQRIEDRLNKTERKVKFTIELVSMNNLSVYITDIKVDNSNKADIRWFTLRDLTKEETDQVNQEVSKAINAYLKRDSECYSQSRFSKVWSMIKNIFKRYGRT